LSKLCIAIPAFNSAHFLPELVDNIITNLPSINDTIIILNDGSHDNTFEVAKNLPRVKAYSNDTNMGYGYTSHKLYGLALENNADYCLHMHSDLSHNPNNINKLLSYMQKNDSDVVVGTRLLYLYELLHQNFWSIFNKNKRNNMPLIRVAGHFMLTGLQNFCYKTNFHCFHEGMRITNNKTMQWIIKQDLPLWYQYDCQLYVNLFLNSFKIHELPVAPFYTNQAKSSAPPFRYGMKCALMALKYKFKIK
jgi:glycosyltransferase involved in cell wall biosynthesis